MTIFRKLLAMLDALRCQRQPGRARYQAAFMTLDGDLLPIETASFHSLANVEWWVHVWVPKMAAERQRRLHGRWVVIDL